MARWAAVLLLVSFVVWRYVPRIRVTWTAVVVLLVVIVGTRSAIAYWS